MERTVTVTRDQAVWERETFEVHVPADMPEDEVAAFVREQVEAGHAKEVCSPYILDNAVEGMDSVVEVQTIVGGPA
jgi:hypothetical protein